MCDLLRKNRPLAKISQNAVGAPKVTLVIKLIPSDKVDTQPKQFLVKKWNLHSLVYILNKFESL